MIAALRDVVARGPNPAAKRLLAENRRLDTEIALQNFRLRLDFQCRALVNDMPVVDDVDPLRQRQCRRQILLHQHDGLAGGGEIAAGSHQIADDDRREPLERLVQQDDFGVPHQRARDRQHLLLATG